MNAINNYSSSMGHFISHQRKNNFALSQREIVHGITCNRFKCIRNEIIHLNKRRGVNNIMFYTTRQ